MNAQKAMIISERSHGLTSQELATRARAGDRAAFEELYNLHVEAVARRISHLCGPVADGAVTDLTQETFASAWKNLGRFRGEVPVSHWLLRIATNLARSHHRRRTSSLWRLWDSPEEEAQVASPLQSVDAGHPALAAVHRALDRLSPKLREAMVLFEMEGLSLEELAAQAQISLNTAGSRVRRGREKLRRILEGMGYAPSGEVAVRFCNSEMP